MKPLKTLSFIAILFTSMMFVSCEEEDITSYDLNGTTWIAYQEDYEVVFDTYGDSHSQYLDYYKAIFSTDTLRGVAKYTWPDGSQEIITEEDGNDYLILGNEIFIESCVQTTIQTTEIPQSECLSGYIDGDEMTLTRIEEGEFHVNTTFHKQ
jgi:hypothetical protein